MDNAINYIRRFIKDLDQFGVVFKPSITQDSEYKTVLGGLLSVLLYGLSLGYFIYQFVMWKEGTMLPKITTSSDIISNQQLYFEDPLFSIRMRQLEDTQIDPFDPSNIVILPLVFIYENGQISKQPQLPRIEQQEGQFSRVYFENITLAISDLRTTEFPELEYTIVLVDCVPQLLNNYQKCANTTMRKAFFNQSLNSLIFTNYVSQFNVHTENINSFGQEIIIALDYTSVYFSTTSLKLQETVIDNGVLFENTYSKNFIVDSSSIGQQVNSKFFAQVLNMTTYYISNYQLNGVKQIQYIQYPKINEVLADTGSIVSILLLTSVLVIMCNQYFLENEAISSVIQIYYPSFKCLQYHKNWLGKITSINLKGRQLNVKKFNENYSKLKVVASTKLTITNQIYEISRLQFLIQQLLNREQIVKSHLLGIKEYQFIENTKEDEYDQSKVAPSNDSVTNLEINQQSQDELSDSDFDILTQKNT